MQDFTSYLHEGLIQNHALGKLPRCNSHIQVQLQSEFFWEETESSSWDHLNLYLLRKVTGFGNVSLLQWWFSSSSSTYIWRRKWQPTPVFLPGESQGRGSLVGCCLWGRTESDTTEVTAAAAETTYITWGALHSQWRFLGANRSPEAKMSG